MDRGASLRALKFWIAFGALSIASTATSHAGVIINATETGGDVVFAGSGSVDVDALFQSLPKSDISRIVPQSPALVFGNDFEVYESVVAPSGFGTIAGVFFADGRTGDAFFAIDNEIGVPTGYASGDVLAFTMTFANESFDTLGLTVGTYVWSWDSDGGTDTVTLNIVSSVPEPSSLAIFGFGALGLVVGGVRRRKQGCNA